MEDPNSRYARSKVLAHTAPDGSQVPYLAPRQVPGFPGDVLTEVSVQVGDRLDVLASTWLGNAEVWWTIADATTALHPGELVATPGARLVIAVPRVG